MKVSHKAIAYTRPLSAAHCPIPLPCFPKDKRKKQKEENSLLFPLPLLCLNFVYFQSAFILIVKHALTFSHFCHGSTLYL